MPDETDEYEEPARVRRQRPAAHGSWTCLAWLIIAGAAGVVVLCCGGGGLLVWFGASVMTADIESQLRDHPELKARLGNVESFSMDYIRSIAEREDTTVYHVKGSLGQGMLTVTSGTDPQGDEVISKATLRMSDGTLVPLIPDAPAP